MERLTLDEAIVHAKEVAEEKYNEGFLCHANPDDGKLDECVKCAQEHEQLAEWLTHLKEYQQLEEQGRLLKLPCKVGDTVWQIMVIRIRGGENKNIEYGYGVFEAMVTELLIIDDNMNILISTTTKYGEKYSNKVTSAAIGETMFFTKSEAEAKLKELRGRE